MKVPQLLMARLLVFKKEREKSHCKCMHRKEDVFIVAITAPAAVKTIEIAVSNINRTEIFCSISLLQRCSSNFHMKKNHWKRQVRVSNLKSIN